MPPPRGESPEAARRSGLGSAGLRRGCDLLIALLVALAIVRPGYGQGTSGVFPDPISGRDLDAYAVRLAMSPQQRLAVDRIHEAYLEETRLLREGPIQVFLDSSGNIMRTFMVAPDVDEMRDALRELNRLNDRIRAADDRLFDRMLPVLSEEQATALPRVRHERERERLLGGVVRYITYAYPVIRTDLAVVADDINLSSPDRATLAPLLADYEARLTTATRHLARKTTEMFGTIIRRIDALGIAETPDGQARLRTAWNELRAIWSEAGTGVIDASGAIAALNRRSARDLASALSRDGGRRLVDEFRRLAFRDVHAGTRVALDRYDAALALPGLEPDRLRAIEAARDALVVRHDLLAERMIDSIEELQREAMLRRLGGRKRDEGAKLKALEEERDAINEEALATLRAILGSEGMDAILSAAHSAREHGRSGGVATGRQAALNRAGANGARAILRRGRRSPTESSRPARRRVDPFLPEAVSASELEAWSARLDLSADQDEVLRSLHEEYLAKFETLRTARIQAVVDSATNLWGIEPESGRLLPPGPAAIDALFRERRETFGAIRALDQALLDDIGLVVAIGDDAARQDAMTAVRRARDRVVYNIGVDPRTGMPFGSRGRGAASRESSLDLGVLFDETGPATETRRGVVETLDAYERTLVGLLEQRYELALDYAQQHESLRAAASRARESAVERMDVGAAYRELSEGTGAELRRTSDAIVTLNRSTLDALVARLPEAAGASLRTAYRHVANPNVFDDGGAVGPLFRETLELDDLDPDQRARVGELFAAYRQEYDRLNEALVALDQADASTATDGRPAWQQRQQRRNDRERIEFQRSELNDKAFRRLRAAISETQAARLGIE